MQGAGAIVAARLPCVSMSTWVNCPIALENVLADKGVHVYPGLSVGVVASHWGRLLTLGPALAGWSPLKTHAKTPENVLADRGNKVWLLTNGLATNQVYGLLRL